MEILMSLAWRLIGADRFKPAVLLSGAASVFRKELGDPPHVANVQFEYDEAVKVLPEKLVEPDYKELMLAGKSMPLNAIIVRRFPIIPCLSLRLP